MAYFQYLSQVNNDCLQASFKNSLEAAGLQVSKEFSTDAQIFAEETYLNKSKVNVIISWCNKSLRECSIEIRSDEPFLMKNTCCERIAKELTNLIPPKT